MPNNNTKPVVPSVRALGALRVQVQPGKLMRTHSLGPNWTDGNGLLTVLDTMSHRLVPLLSIQPLQVNIGSIDGSEIWYYLRDLDEGNDLVRNAYVRLLPTPPSWAGWADIRNVNVFFPEPPFDVERILQSGYSQWDDQRAGTDETRLSGSVQDNQGPESKPALRYAPNENITGTSVLPRDGSGVDTLPFTVYTTSRRWDASGAAPAPNTDIPGFPGCSAPVALAGTYDLPSGSAPAQSYAVGAFPFAFLDPGTSNLRIDPVHRFLYGRGQNNTLADLPTSTDLFWLPRTNTPGEQPQSNTPLFVGVSGTLVRREQPRMFDRLSDGVLPEPEGFQTTVDRPPQTVRRALIMGTVWETSSVALQASLRGVLRSRAYPFPLVFEPVPPPPPEPFGLFIDAVNNLYGADAGKDGGLNDEFQPGSQALLIDVPGITP
jgi:hypothetical protein